MSDRLQELQRRLEAAARKHWTYRVEALESEEGWPLWRVRVPTRGRQHYTICLAAGIHGDEPAGVEAALRLLEQQPFPAGVTVDVFPCMNPQGYAAGTRENGAGLDLNRQFGCHPTIPPLNIFLKAVAGRRYDLFIDLHEDCGTEGFYLWEIEEEAGSLGPGIIKAMEALGFRLEPAAALKKLLLEDGLEYQALQTGLVVEHLDRAALVNAAQSVYMRAHHTEHMLTLESPSRQPLELRVQMHLAALSFLFKQLKQQNRFATFTAHHDYGAGRLRRRG